MNTTAVSKRGMIFVVRLARAFLDTLACFNQLSLLALSVQVVGILACYEDCSCGLQAYSESDSDHQERILGVIAGIDEYPWAALLFYKNDFQGCGGVLISSNYVLTAAHCLTGSAYKYHAPLTNVRLGEYNLQSNPDCVILEKEGQYFEDCALEKLDRPPRGIKIHSEYVPDTNNQLHDLALIEIDPVNEYSDFVRPICLPEGDELSQLSPGMKLSVCGWGRTDFFSEGNSPNYKSPIKMKADLPLLDLETCKRLYSDQSFVLSQEQICVGGQAGRDTCSADSGGPLMFYDDQTERWILVGIVSRGWKTCGVENRPGIYTYVKKYIAWILTNIG